MAKARKPKAPKSGAAEKELSAIDASEPPRTRKRVTLSKPDLDEVDITSMDAAETLEAQLIFLRRLQAAADATIADGKMSATFLREAQGLSRSIANVITAQQRQEKHVRDQVKLLTHEETHRLVAEYMRECDYDGRKIFRDIIIELDGEKSLLG